MKPPGLTVAVVATVAAAVVAAVATLIARRPVRAPVTPGTWLPADRQRTPL